MLPGLRYLKRLSLSDQRIVQVSRNKPTKAFVRNEMYLRPNTHLMKDSARQYSTKDDFKKLFKQMDNLKKKGKKKSKFDVPFSQGLPIRRTWMLDIEKIIHENRKF